MKYYKLINGSTFIGVGTDSDLRRYQLKHKIILACLPEQAQYIQIGEILYHAKWMLPETIENSIYTTVDILEIEKSEYDALYSAVESGEEVKVDQKDDLVDEEPTFDESVVVTVDFVKSCKIDEMNLTCSRVITDGFDTVLSDELPHHFSLTTQDQLNLITLSSLIASGETAIPYHADGELCKFFSAEDIQTILASATNFKTYQVSYYNSLKAYIESLNDIDTISAITYGIEIPEDYQSDVLRVLYMQSEDGK